MAWSTREALAWWHKDIGEGIDEWDNKGRNNNDLVIALNAIANLAEVQNEHIARLEEEIRDIRQKLEGQ